MTIQQRQLCSFFIVVILTTICVLTVNHSLFFVKASSLTNNYGISSSSSSSSGHPQSTNSKDEGDDDLRSTIPFVSSIQHLNRYQKAKELAQFEQDVEDYNAAYVASCKTKLESISRRRLICLPLDERFNPPMGQFSHNHVQNGDKMSLPSCFYDAVSIARDAVPYLFIVSRIDGVTSSRVENISLNYAPEPLNEVVGGPLDFRAPDNYCFLPWWMMRSLGLHPRDVVEVKYATKTIKPGSLAKFRPHTSDFAKDISNARAVLETELRHYSALTLGSAIAFEYNGKLYWFDVEELRSAPKNEKANMVKVQDCDLSTDFFTAKDKKKKKMERQLQQEEEEEDEEDD